MKIAILGAESTGKTQLSLALTTHLQASGQIVSQVGEFLREWCAREARTPTQQEQPAIAREQMQRIKQAAHRGCVIADTTALTTAVYSHLLFGDRSLYALALQQQQSFDLTILTGLDLPWVEDGLQRDGPHLRTVVDQMLRDALIGAGLAFQVVQGVGAARLQQALAAIGHARQRASTTSGPGAARWRWHCERCSQADCEHRLFFQLQQAPSVGA